ncbi:MAG: hypothetical protein JWQ92_1633, partial [Amnibacterium sp.]|nr:hypothetical protein [Amnibacterium sp.]
MIGIAPVAASTIRGRMIGIA